jgi:hypothetical protein
MNEPKYARSAADPPGMAWESEEARTAWYNAQLRESVAESQKEWDDLQAELLDAREMAKELAGDLAEHLQSYYGAFRAEVEGNRVFIEQQNMSRVFRVTVEGLPAQLEPIWFEKLKGEE